MVTNSNLPVLRAFNLVNKPFRGVECILYEVSPTQFELVVFQDQVMSLSAVQQEEFMLWLTGTQARIEMTGVNCVLANGGKR